MLSWFSGVKLYALAAVGILVLSLSGAVYILYLWHQEDTAKLALAKQKYEEVSNALAESEANNAKLVAMQKELDAAVLERDKRLRALNEAKRKLSDELDGLRKTLPAEDQACLTRDLPDAVLGLLRGGPGNGDKDANPQGSGKPAQSVS